MQVNRSHRLSAMFKVIISLTFMFYCFLLVVKSIAGFPASPQTQSFWPWLGDRPVGEDGFYMLTVAYNYAATHKFVYNRGMPATGVQPLGTLIFTGIAEIVRHFSLDRWTFVRSIIAFDSILFVLFAWIISTLASGFVTLSRRDLVSNIAFVLILSDFSLFRLFTYGLETGVYLCLLTACFALWQILMEAERAKWATVLLFGVAAGFTGLARIDFGLCFAVLLLFLMIKRKGTLAQVIAAGTIALICVSPWFIFIHRASGKWLPSSGGAESSLINNQDALGRLYVMLMAIITHLIPWSGAGFMVVPTDLLVLISIVILIPACIGIHGAGEGGQRESRFSNTLIPWLLSFIALAVAYVLFFWSTHFYTRYLAPTVIITVPLLAVALSKSSFVQQRPSVIYSVLFAIFCVFDFKSLHSHRPHESQFMMASYINRWYPDSRVAAFQSGTVGFFNPNVMNIDGKLNDKALEAARERKLPEYLDGQDVDIIIDWPMYIDRLPENYRSLTYQTCPQATPDLGANDPTGRERIICIIRKAHN